MSSRLDGRRVIVTTPLPGVDAGAVFWIVGNALACAEDRVYTLGVPTGHRDTVTTPRRTNRDPLRLNVRRPPEVPDELLAARDRADLSAERVR